VTWHRNDMTIQAGPRLSFVHEGNFYCVDVAPVTVEDQGHWTCMAENRSGRSSCTSHLNVLGKYIILERQLLLMLPMPNRRSFLFPWAFYFNERILFLMFSFDSLFTIKRIYKRFFINKSKQIFKI
jgi:hypothetical protein